MMGSVHELPETHSGPVLWGGERSVQLLPRSGNGCAPLRWCSVGVKFTDHLTSSTSFGPYGAGRGGDDPRTVACVSVPQLHHVNGNHNRSLTIVVPHDPSCMSMCLSCCTYLTSSKCSSDVCCYQE